MPPSTALSTCAYRLKALLLCVRGVAGKELSARFVERAEILRPLDDETRPISRQLWVQALPVFAELLGEAGFQQLPDYVVHPENLGFWSPLLRNAEDPGAVYSHLADSVTAPEQLSEWREEERGEQFRVLSTPLPETDPELRRLVTLALRAELEAVPLLFGRPRATLGRSACSSGRLFLTAHFSPAPSAFGKVGLAATALGGVSAATAAAMVDAPAVQIGFVTAAGSTVAAAVAWVLGREVAHRAAATYQRTRILSLEREGRVRKDQTSEISGTRKESLIAGEYRIGEQLGVGGASAVWEAHRISDGQAFAIKLLRTATASDSRASDRLRREAEALGLTWHPHVVKVHDHGLLPSGLGYLVMERLRGETLAARVKRLRALPPEEVARFGLQAAEALWAVHQAGIVHRDVKPANLFVHREGGSEILKLFDFGVAHVNWAETRLTRDGAAIGTPGYAPPEQEDGAPSHPSADLFALGVSLMELLTGEPPSSTGSARRLRTSRPPPPGTSEPASPSNESEELRDLLHQMTALEPKDRPADAREVVQRLRGFLGMSVRSVAPSTASTSPLGPAPVQSLPVGPGETPPSSTPPGGRLGGNRRK